MNQIKVKRAAAAAVDPLMFLMFFAAGALLSRGYLAMIPSDWLFATGLVFAAAAVFAMVVDVALPRNATRAPAGRGVIPPSTPDRQADPSTENR